MKRFFGCIAAVMCALMLFTACGKEESTFEPIFEVGESFTRDQDVISGTILGEEYISLFSVFTTEETFIILGDESAESFLEKGIIPLKAGKNRFVARFLRGETEREIEILLEYIPIRSFSVEMINAEKTYHIGEKFDQTTIRVLAETADGKTVEAEHYFLEYAFSELGESDVGIELGSMYESITVQVTEEYRPTLDGNFQADGVTYAVRGGQAVLLSAKHVSGFFAVPETVISEGVEYPVKEIANGAFARTELQSILIPEGVEILATGVFSGCGYLEEVMLPETLVSIGRQAFSECTSLSRIDLPDGITKLEYGTFLGCTSLFRVNLPTHLTVIGEMAFSGCEKLKNIAFPRELSVIEREAFADCSSLVSIVLGNLQSIGDGAFRNCEKLETFAMADAEILGNDIFEDAKPKIYTVQNSNLHDDAKSSALSVQIVGDVPHIISVPKTFAIEDGFPYSEFFALIAENGEIAPLKNYEISYAPDACGNLSLTVTWGEFVHTETVFVSYTETVLIDTDTRGARYILEPIGKTAVLVELPTYVLPSEIYQPEKAGLFIVPTTLSCPDGEYRVVDVGEQAADGCENVSEIFVPIQ